MGQKIFQIKSAISPKEIEEKFLNPNFKELIISKREELQNTLEQALAEFHSINLSESARNFRKIANDLKKLEMRITHEGNMSERNCLNDLTGKNWLRRSKSWIVFDGKPGDITKEIKEHPASYPPELAEYFIEFFTKKSQWVLDPFMGIGSTAEACLKSLRNCIGTELNPKYAKFANIRVNEKMKELIKDAKDKSRYENLHFLIENNDASKIQTVLKKWQKIHSPSKINFVITSPPYWNMLKKSRGGVKSALKKRVEEGFDEDYGNNEADIGTIQDYDLYLEQITSIFKKIDPFLAKKAYIMVILQNMRKKDGIMQPIAWDFAQKMSKYFALRQEFIWCQDQKFMGIWGYPTTYVSNVHHHYCLIFQKIWNSQDVNSKK